MRLSLSCCVQGGIYDGERKGPSAASHKDTQPQTPHTNTTPHHTTPPGKEQAQDEEDMLDDFLLAHGGQHLGGAHALHLRARGEEESDVTGHDDEEGEASGGAIGTGEEEEDGGAYDAAAMDAEEAAFLEAQLTDERRATLRWLRRLRGHLVQYPVEFLAEDLPALKPINGLEGWVL